MKLRFAQIAFTLLPAQLLFAQQSSRKALDQFWPETDLFVRLNSSSRLFFLWSGTRTEAGGYTDGQAGAHIDLFVPPLLFKDRLTRHPDIAKNKFLTVRLGYLYGRTPHDAPTPFIEHTPTVEANSRFFLKHILLTNRNRFDFRFIDGSYTPRYRTRLKAEGTIPIGRFSLTPYAHAEAFYDWRYNAFHRFRFAGGAEFEVTRHIVLESYYLHQIDTQSSSRHQNIGGLSLQFYFR